ncbi:MAG: flavodoxin [Dehalococcoidia bacterium]|nr:flavodoxin [Dehalococcoidia bacterium]
MASGDIVIVCASVHHGNTRRVAEAMAAASGGHVYEPGDEALRAAGDCALLGIGSGIYFGHHHTSLLAFAGALEAGRNRSAFIFSTSGTGDRLARLAGRDYHQSLRTILCNRRFRVEGEFSCRGYDTYAPWRIFGGFARGHPDMNDLQNARTFMLSLGRGI